jgi:hypothetical protein
MKLLIIPNDSATAILLEEDIMRKKNRKCTYTGFTNPLPERKTEVGSKDHRIVKLASSLFPNDEVPVTHNTVPVLN